MGPITVPAHFDGERILLDVPLHLEPNAELLVTVVPNDDAERAAWLALSARSLASAYGRDEPDYGPDCVREANPLPAGGWHRPRAAAAV